MKKFISLALFVVMLTSMFTGCKTTNVGEVKDGSAPKENVGEVKDDPAPKEEPTSFVFMTRESESAGTSYKTMSCVAQEALEKLTGVKIIWDIIPNEEYLEVMQLRFATKKDMPDFVEILGESSGSYLGKYFQDKVIISLNDLIEKNAPGFQKLFEEYPEYKEQMTLPDGNVVGLGGVDATKYSASVMLIRKDWLDKVNLPIPKTIDELYNAVKAFQEADFDGNGKDDTIGLSGQYYSEFKQLGMAFGLDLTIGKGWATRDGKVIYEFIQPEYMEFLKWMNKAYKDGILSQDMVNSTADAHTARLLNGSIGISIRNGCNNILEWNQPGGELQKAQPGALWVPFVPSGPFGASVVPKEPTASRWRVIGITTECKNPEAAMKYWDTVRNSKEAMMIGDYGVEGITYNMVDGIPTRIAEPVLPQGKFFGRNVWQGTNNDEKAEMAFKVDWFVNHPQNKLMTDTIKETMDQVTNGFVPAIPSIDVSKRVSSIMGDLTTAIDEYMTKFILGEIELTQENFDKYVGNIKDLGAAELIEIYQEGYDNNKGIK